jgi:hypothetical protein
MELIYYQSPLFFLPMSYSIHLTLMSVLGTLHLIVALCLLPSIVDQDHWPVEISPNTHIWAYELCTSTYSLPAEIDRDTVMLFVLIIPASLFLPRVLLSTTVWPSVSISLGQRYELEMMYRPIFSLVVSVVLALH